MCLASTLNKIWKTRDADNFERQLDRISIAKLRKETANFIT